MGSNFVRFLKEVGSEPRIVIVDKLTYAGNLDNVIDVIDNKRIVFIRGDICDEKFLEDVVKEYDVDVIINFAGETHVDRSINEPAPFIRTNIFGVFTILEICRRFDIKLIHISTDEVYGDLWNIDGFASEDWCLNPSNPYSASKASCDLLIKAYGRTYGLDYIIVRPCNNYGPYQHPEKLIPRTIVRLLYGKPATIYGDGSQIRDWLYVEDFCEALYTVMMRGNWRDVYNICAEQYKTVREIVIKIVELLGKDPNRDVVYVKGRPGEDRRYAMKCDKIKSLGWKPKHTIDEGLRKTVKWYIENKWWWMKIVEREDSRRYVLDDVVWR